jgi:Leucine-rich repeat (LRR) protein
MLFGCSKLRKLEVRETAITDTELRDFLSLSCTQKEFKELDISGNKITDESFAVLTQTSKPLQLQKLHLSDTTIGTATLRILNQIVTGLTDLDLGLQEKLDRDDIVRIGTQAPHTFLFIMFTIVEQIVTTQYGVGEVQTRLRKLKIVNGKQGVNGALLTLEHQLNPPSLESIELPWCSIRDLMIHGLSKTFRTLQAIDLTGCHEISNHTLMGLRQVSTSLTYLNLSWCSQLVDHTMVEILRECPNITRLSLAHCAQLTTNALEEIPRGLVSLDVSHCLMFALLGKMPARCLHLKEINLACVTIPSKELRVLFSFGISLNTLNLKGMVIIAFVFVRPGLTRASKLQASSKWTTNLFGKFPNIVHFLSLLT